ncbi:GNAT family N-acetyltransferase [Actinomyces polynesiensis]|uniref:GNAT family N-acetyltransferase n=1 Tax=Actinomyces polynesiensis TaxID=1325934 RepID=UPI0005BD288E|nr:GNAT family N-acetyltransferase [Actinomyces polynesiensis]
MTGLAARLVPPASVPYPGAHLGLRWRPLIASDAPVVAELIRRVEAADDAIHRTSAAEVADMMEGLRGTDPLDTIVGLDAGDRVVAVASVRVVARVTEMAVAVVNAYIAPHWRGRGLGRSLLYWQDGRARQLLVDHFGADSEVPAAVTNIVDSHMTDRRRLYIAGGFHAQRTFAVMYREIEGSETAPAPRDGYRVVPWDGVDTSAVRELHMQVFEEHFWPEMRGVWWQEALTELDPRWSFVALDPQGRPAGYAAVGRPVERWLAEGRTEAYVELIGVGGGHRGRGLTSALIGAAVAAAARSGVSRIGLDVDTKGATNAHAIYEHLGFIDDRSQVYYSIDH